MRVLAGRLCAAAVVALLVPAALPSTAAPLTAELSPVIITGPSAAIVHTTVSTIIAPLGAGDVAFELPLVNGVLAHLTTAEIALLPTGYVVSPDATVLPAM